MTNPFRSDQLLEALLAKPNPQLKSTYKVTRPSHQITRIWQERPGEVSWSCCCGHVMKHVRFDGPAGVAVPECPDATR